MAKARHLVVPAKRIPAINKRTPPFDPIEFLAHAGVGRTIVVLKRKQIVFSQGDAAEAVFYIQRGQVRLTVVSSRGKEATIALLGAGDFLGEECVANSYSHDHRHRHYRGNDPQDRQKRDGARAS